MSSLRRAECPCGTGTAYDACCGRLHRGEALAQSPEELMRSRYSAYVVGDGDHLFRTWHPRTRPEDTSPDPRVRWTGLEVMNATDDGDRGTVEFRAHHEGGLLHEVTRFERRAGRWVYVDGDLT